MSANAGGKVGGLALIRLNVAGDVHSGGGTLLENQATGFNVVGGPFIAPGLIVGDALISVSAANLTSELLSRATYRTKVGASTETPGSPLTLPAQLPPRKLISSSADPLGTLAGTLSFS